MDTDPKPPQTPAERHYEAMKKAQRDYWRRKHPNPRPVGRPRKLAVPPQLAVIEETPATHESGFVSASGV